MALQRVSCVDVHIALVVYSLASTRLGVACVIWCLLLRLLGGLFTSLVLQTCLRTHEDD